MVIQLSLLEPSPTIPTITGLQYLPDYISPEAEIFLVEEIERAGWQHVGMRRLVRQFGYRYSFSRKAIAPDDTQEPLPDWGLAIAQRIYQNGLTMTQPNQMLANRYLPGEGISFHIDAPGFDEVLSLSLLSACVMEFRHTQTGEKQQIWLEPRSLLVLSGEARWQWEHGIAARKRDRYAGREQMREQRVSLTFRTVTPAKKNMPPCT